MRSVKAASFKPHHAGSNDIPLARISGVSERQMCKGGVGEHRHLFALKERPGGLREHYHDLHIQYDSSGLKYDHFIGSLCVAVKGY